MKVLQITTNYPTISNPIFGIFMKEQVESLEKFNVENTIFFSNGSERKVGKKGAGAIIHFKSIFKLMWHLLTNRYDIIHCHSSLSGMILFLSGGAFFNKTVISFQNDPEQEGDKSFFKILYPFYDVVIVKKHTKYDSWKKTVYLPNGCNMNFFHPMDTEYCKKQIGLDLNKRYVLFVDSNTSRKRTQKRKDRFDKVLELLKNQYAHNDIEELVMIGVPRSAVPIWMNACELHLLSSDQEGSPNSVKECLCCNVPVVSTNVGNVHDLLDDTENCFVDDSFSAENLAYLCDKVLRSPKSSSLNQSIIKKKLDIESVADTLYRLYDDCVNG